MTSKQGNQDKKLVTGMNVLESGEYLEVNERGEHIGGAQSVSCHQGKTFPPFKYGGKAFVKVEDTKSDVSKDLDRESKKERNEDVEIDDDLDDLEVDEEDGEEEIDPEAEENMDSDSKKAQKNGKN